MRWTLLVLAVACGSSSTAPTRPATVDDSPPVTPITDDSTTPAQPVAKHAPRPAALNDCRGGEKIEPEPDGIAPDKTTKARVVVVYDPGYANVDDRLNGANRD